jgi:hypothetical protein
MDRIISAKFLRSNSKIQNSGPRQSHANTPSLHCTKAVNFIWHRPKNISFYVAFLTFHGEIPPLLSFKSRTYSFYAHRPLDESIPRPAKERLEFPAKTGGG